jgi:hypothetical protein
MIDEKRLVASIGLFGNSTKSKKLATNLSAWLVDFRTSEPLILT